MTDEDVSLEERLSATLVWAASQIKIDDRMTDFIVYLWNMKREGISRRFLQ